ncbi:MAG TPA: hypothetical protein VKE88_00015, partial [Candidatus Nanoarchaeia archaeon]|nr:hypothetical protein [Candidatus Nanoarchaeia archaeon]
MVTKRGDMNSAFLVVIILLLFSLTFASALNDTTNFTSTNESVLDNITAALLLENTSIENTTDVSSTDSNVTIHETVTVDLNVSLNETADVQENSSEENVSIISGENITEPIEEIKEKKKDSIEVSVDIKNRKGKQLSANIEITEEDTTVTEALSAKEAIADILANETFNVKITPYAGPVEKIVLNDVIPSDNISIGLEDVPETIDAPVGTWEEVYAIDPSAINFTNGTVTATATGNSLYKCKAWNFTEQRCDGTWEFFMSITPGEQYNFTLTPDDPGFGEIIVATTALHLDQDYTVIADIYPQINVTDDIWSEPIYAGEYVRVLFEKNLTSENVIDVVVRSNNTYAYFEVYIANTTEVVGRSGIATKSEIQYIQLTNLSTAADTFDFKVVKVMADPLDDSPSYDDGLNSFLEFDYIHDAAINSTSADGLVVYSELNVQTPRYRLWNSSLNNFGAELTAPTISGDASWTIVKGSHERDEFIAGFIDNTGNDVNIQIFNGTREWQSLLEVSNAVPNSAQRAFDIEYERVSGDALIVFENSTATDSLIFFRTWDGTGYSAAQSFTHGLGNSNIHWVSLIPQRRSDNIMLLMHNATAGIQAVMWNGTG